MGLQRNHQEQGYFHVDVSNQIAISIRYNTEYTFFQMLYQMTVVFDVQIAKKMGL
jgi:hypothetical protein